MFFGMIQDTNTECIDYYCHHEEIYNDIEDYDLLYSILKHEAIEAAIDGVLLINYLGDGEYSLFNNDCYYSSHLSTFNKIAHEINCALKIV